MKRPDWHSLNMFVKVLSHPDHEVVLKDKLRQLDWLAECIFFGTCWLELAEGGVTTLWSSKGLTGAEQGRCVARQ